MPSVISGRQPFSTLPRDEVFGEHAKNSDTYSTCLRHLGAFDACWACPAGWFLNSEDTKKRQGEWTA